MTACGRGIQPSDDHEIIIIDDNDSTTTTSSGVIKSNDEVSVSFQAKGLTDSFSEIVQNVAEVWYNDNEVISVFIYLLKNKFTFFLF